MPKKKARQGQLTREDVIEKLKAAGLVEFPGFRTGIGYALSEPEQACASVLAYMERTDEPPEFFAWKHEHTIILGSLNGTPVPVTQELLPEPEPAPEYDDDDELGGVGSGAAAIPGFLVPTRRIRRQDRKG